MSRRPRSSGRRTAGHPGALRPVSRLESRPVVTAVGAIFAIGATAIAIGVASPAAAAAKDKFCGEVAKFAAVATALASVDGRDVAATSDQFAKTAKSLKDLANKAPSAIKADVKQLSASISTIDGLLRKLADTKLSDAAKVSKEVTPKLNAAINDKRLDAATGRINVWATKNCG